jgi:hypothetical protein
MSEITEANFYAMKGALQAIAAGGRSAEELQATAAAALHFTRKNKCPVCLTGFDSHDGSAFCSEDCRQVYEHFYRTFPMIPEMGITVSGGAT